MTELRHSQRDEAEMRIAVAIVCLETVEKPGVHGEGAPGSVVRRAWELGRELQNLRDQVTVLLAQKEELEAHQAELIATCDHYRNESDELKGIIR